MTMSYQSKRQPFLITLARLPLLTAPRKRKDALEKTNAAASMDPLEETKRVLGVLGKAMNPVFSIYDLNSCGHEKLRKADTRVGLA